MQRIRELRKARGWTLEELAGRVGSAVSHLSNVETGKKDPSFELLRDIAKELSVTVLELQGAKKPRSFHEPEVKPFNFDRAGNSAPGLTLALIAPNAQSPMAFMFSSDYEAFGYLPDTLLVIDNKQKPEDGDIVVVNIYDMESGEATTKIGRMIGSVLLGPKASTDPTDYTRLDQAQHTVYGPVVASLWGQALRNFS